MTYSSLSRSLYLPVSFATATICRPSVHLNFQVRRTFLNRDVRKIIFFETGHSQDTQIPTCISLKPCLKGKSDETEWSEDQGHWT